jgi:hypothetical protein
VSPPNIAHHCDTRWRRRKNEEPSSISNEEFRDKFRNILGEVFESYAIFLNHTQVSMSAIYSKASRGSFMMLAMVP